MPGIPELAEGLASHIDTLHSNKSKVVLIGHSMGGLILRHYIVNEFKKSRENKILAAAMIATPHTGADLARYGKALSWRHTHLKQLAKGESILQSILTDWGVLDIEKHIKTLYVTGGIDAVVARDSSMPYYGGVNFQNLINHGHIDIIKPDNAQDIRFKVLKKFIEALAQPKKTESGQPTAEGWPLFFRYEKKCERFYLTRQTDEVIEQTLPGSNIWLSGPAGVGKTVALTRAILKQGWTIYYFTLDGFSELSASNLMKEICRQLMDRIGISDENLNTSSSTPDILRCFATALSSANNLSKIALFIEEIPIISKKEYANFLELAYHLSMTQETCKREVEVIWIFSSIVDPIPFTQNGNIKIHERYSFLRAPSWTHPELSKLLKLIDGELKFGFTPAEEEEILAASQNSPRHLKILLKARRTEVGSKKSVADLISSISMGASHD